MFESATTSICFLRRPSDRRFGYGFTLVELLVVIGIVGILIGFMLPAVQMVREAGRRAACQSKLHNLGIGVLSFESARQVFPQGATASNLHSWATLTLPYLEQQGLYDSIRLDKAWNDAGNFSFASTDLPIFHCPTSSKRYNGKTDYCGISGSWRVEVAPPPGTMNGIFYPVSSRRHFVRMASVLDGTSQTIAVSEGVSVLEPNHGYWASGYHCFTHEDGGINAPNLPEDEITSDHPTGANAVFCDGSVRFLSVEMDADLVAALCTRDGGEQGSQF